MNSEFVLIGAPSSAGAHAPGQEKAPFLLREAGLLRCFADFGLDVSDSGNLPGFRYKSDPSSPRARNVQAVADNARRVADSVADALNDGKRYIVLGGDCTNGAGVLQSDQIVLLGWDYDGSNSDWERENIIRRDIKVVSLEELKAEPAVAAKQALAMLGPVDRVVVHFDVDVIDFADCPLSENYRHGTGCTLDQAMAALSVLASKKEFAGVTVTELNPDHGEEELATLKLFSKCFAQSLAGKVSNETANH